MFVLVWVVFSDRGHDRRATRCVELRDGLVLRGGARSKFGVCANTVDACLAEVVQMSLGIQMHELMI